MKNLTKLSMAAILAVFATIVASLESTANAQEIQQKDTVANILARFCNRDTVVYQILDTQVSMNGEDTISNEASSSKVMLNVMDSTSTGYKIRFTYLDMQMPAGNDYSDFKTQLLKNIARQFEGGSIDFVTNENGEILEFTNMDEIDEKSKKISEYIMESFEHLPFAKDLAENGIDLKTLMGFMGPDLVKRSYLQGVKQLFDCYGKAYDLGKTTLKNEEGAPLGDAKTTQTVTRSDNGVVTITTDVKTPLPKVIVKQALDKMMSGIKNEKLHDAMEKDINEDILDNGEVESVSVNEFLPNGWLLRNEVKIETYLSGTHQLNQKLMTIISASFKF